MYKFWSTFCLMLFCLSWTTSSYAADDLNVIVNNSGLGEQHMSKAQLKRIYIMRMKSWPNGQPIKVFSLPSNSQLTKDFSKQFLGMSTYQLASVWNRLIFSGRGTAPIILDSEDELIKKVLSTPGSIGYVSHLSESLKPLLVAIH